MSGENTMSEENHQLNPNRGHGAGGSQTNANGIKLEDKVRGIIGENVEIIDISSRYPVRPSNKWKAQNIIHNGRNYIRAPETAFKPINDIEGNNDIPQAHGTKEPDDLILNEITKTINWIECKVQNGTGSVAEKLQTVFEKRKNLKRRFPDWNINYVYILSPYFRSCESEILRLDEENIKYIFEDDENFQGKLLDYSFL